MQNVATRARELSAAGAALMLLSVGGCAGMDAMAAGPMGDAFAAASGIPQMQAFLPYAHNVPQTGALEIDGDYTISTLGKSVRFEGGRAFALAPWTHALTLKIQPNMVVIQNIRQTGSGTYVGDDLPLMGPATMTVMPDGQIAVSVDAMVDYQYVLIPETSASSPDYKPPSPPPADAEETGECEMEVIDPDTDEIICLDV